MESIIGSIISGPLIVAVVVSFVFAKISKRQEKTRARAHRAVCSFWKCQMRILGQSDQLPIAVRDKNVTAK